MKKILIFISFLGFLACVPAMSAVRDGTTTNLRSKPTNSASQTRTTTVLRSNNDTGRGAITRSITPRSATTPITTTRAGTMRITGASTRVATNRPIKQLSRSAVGTTTGRGANLRNSTTARAASQNPATTMAETRTGAAYTQCKTAYFQCMDQFCQLKNDDYRRCSCSSRIHDLKSARENITDTNNKLSEFTENLDVVGMTAAQATAMHTASDGENALAADMSASKALLEAIMKSIRGQDATVAGKMSDLNSINLSFDTSNAFGITDAAQVIASYNGTELYNAVYPSCRNAVAADCTDATLQRAVTAYLMAIEQDCNTVQTALENKQKELKGAIREGGAMLDLARVENRHKHNSDTLATCINNIESAILSEQVCGANYHRCLDNGEFIDVETGAPLEGVVHFYELGNLLKFEFGKNAVDQKLSKISNNQKFVKAFESKTKKFAADALDRCTEISDTAWQEYLDKALLAIYYAQQDKVTTIKNGCFDLISACYEDKETAITAAMATLIDGTTELSLMPDKIVLTKEMCSNYIDSCNNMFANDENNQNVIADYIAQQADKDRLDACRAIVQQCFNNFGGTNYENFYYPSSGLFIANYVDNPAYEKIENNGTIEYHSIDRTYKKSALDWFTLYQYDKGGNRVIDDRTHKPVYVSECAKQVASVTSCADLVESAFGGLDRIIAQQEVLTEYGTYNYTSPSGEVDKDAFAYGWTKTDDIGDGADIWTSSSDYKFQNRRLRPTGVATEVYNNIIDTLSTQCMNLQGKFIESQFVDHNRYGADENTSICNLTLTYEVPGYGINTGYQENMCPKDYMLTVDTVAWGICSCWENGGRRSKNGLFGKCTNVIPVTNENPNDNACGNNSLAIANNGGTTIDKWCSSIINIDTNQVCPFGDQSSQCVIPDNDGNSLVPSGI